MTRGFPRKGDVLFTTEAPLGNVAQVIDENIALAQRVLTLQTNPKLLSDFLFYLLMDFSIRRQFEYLSSGSTVTGIKQSQFRNIYIKFPDKVEQKKIVDAIRKLDCALFTKERQLKKLKHIKVGLMQDLLTGNIRVANLLKQ
jgi:type I restriction enzyme S subunit